MPGTQTLRGQSPLPGTLTLNLIELPFFQGFQKEFEGSSLIDYYRSRGAEPVICNKKRLVSEGYHVLQAPLYSKRITPTLRHDYRRLARAVMYLYKKIKKAN